MSISPGRVVFRAESSVVYQNSSKRRPSNSQGIRHEVPVPGSQTYLPQCEMAGMATGQPVCQSAYDLLAASTKKLSRMNWSDDDAENDGSAENLTENNSDVHGAQSELAAAELVERERTTEISRQRAVAKKSSADVVLEYPVLSSSLASTAASVPPLFSFGVITDVQYADIPDGHSYGGVPRFYRHSLEVLNRAVRSWNENYKLSFAIHFGDIVDGFCPKEESRTAVVRVLNEFKSFKGGPVYHMIGNHCLYNLPRAELNQLFDIPPSPDGRSYYQFFPGSGFRFVVLDGYDISELGWPEGHPNRQKATELLASINPNIDKNSPIGLEGEKKRFVKFNGGVGSEQLRWLNDVLREATDLKQKVVICCHLPLHPQIPTHSALCWNFQEVLDVLYRFNCVVACLSGHAHSGGYTLDSHQIHHVVLEAVLECPSGMDAYGHIDVYPGRLSLKGKDRMTSREMTFTDTFSCM